MEIVNPASMAREALDAVSSALHTFVTGELRRALGDSWFDTARTVLRPEAQGRVRGAEHLDLADLVSLVCYSKKEPRVWDTFAHRPDYQLCDPMLRELQVWRNKLAHPTPHNRHFGPSDAQRVVETCAWVLDWIKCPEDAADLRRALDQMPKERPATADVSEMHHVVPLLSALTGKDETLHFLAAQGLGALGASAAPAVHCLCEAMVESLGEDEGTWHAAFDALVRIGPPGAAAIGAWLEANKNRGLLEGLYVLPQINRPLPGIASALPGVIAVIQGWASHAEPLESEEDTLTELLQVHSVPAVRALQVIAGRQAPVEGLIDASLLLYDRDGMKHSPDEIVHHGETIDLDEGVAVRGPYEEYPWGPSRRAESLLHEIRQCSESAAEALEKERIETRDEGFKDLLWRWEGSLAEIREAAQGPADTT